MTKTGGAEPITGDSQFEMRLFLEELVCDLRRFHHSERGKDAQEISIRQELCLGAPDVFADIAIECPGEAPYLVEVDYGYAPAQVLASIRRKFGCPRPALDRFSGLILVTERIDTDLDRQVRSILPESWTLEVWDDAMLRKLIDQHFHVVVEAFDPGSIQDVREAIDCAKGTFAFDTAWRNAPLEAALLWHFGYSRLRKLFRATGGDMREVVPPRRYEAVAVLFADIAGYSAFVRDTPDVRTVQNCLTAFCAKSRYQVINDGGMLYQFLGDCVVAVFGIPEAEPGYVDRAFRCAMSLLEITKSVSNEWQRRIDRVQPKLGGHIGVALGDLSMVSLRPFSRTHIGALGDTINMASRLCAVAECDQILVSNMIYRHLGDDMKARLTEMKPIEAKNVGSVRSWLFDQRAGACSPPA